MNIPHFDQWLGDWAMEPDRFMAAYRSLVGMDLHVHLQTGPERAAAVAREQSQPVNVGDVAVVGLYGILMKSVPSGEQGTSTVLARRKIRAAAADPAVSAIMLHISSPGGTVDGTEALASDVADARKKKPVYAFVEDLGASAAYWIASQADKIFANGTALVGSIGTYAVVNDMSGMAAQKGIKVHVVRAGEMKGQGEPGTEISAELLAELQTRVNSRNDFFIRGVAAGRGLSEAKARELADGRVHIAAQAQAKGLIDGVQAFDVTMTQLAAFAMKRRTKMDATMTAAVVETAVEQGAATGGAVPAQHATGNTGGQAASGTQTSRPATLGELKAACPGAGNDFLVAQLEANATAGQAAGAWTAQVSRENADLKQKLANAEKTSATASSTPKKPGAPSVPAARAASAEQQEDDSEPIQAFENAVQAHVGKGMERSNAIDLVAKRQPELHRNYLLATNADRNAATRLLKEKFNV